MALLLCQGIGNLCSSICEGLTHICNLPCRICGSGCRFATESLCQACTSPFFPYLAVTCGLNLPTAVWGVQAFLRGCNSTWLTVNAILTAIHIVAAFYIVTKIQAENWDDDASVVGAVLGSGGGAGGGMGGGGDMEKGGGGGGGGGGGMRTSTSQYQRVTETRAAAVATGSVGAGPGRTVTSFLMMSSTSSESRANSISRLIQVLCYDAGVAIYIIVFVGWMIWLSMGATHMITGGKDEGAVEYDDSCDSVEKWVRNSVILGWCYMMLVCCSFCCSLVCVRP